MNQQRYYPHVATIADAHEAIKQLTDHTYELRSKIERLEASHAEMKQKQSGPAPFTGDIQGIKVKAVTDPVSLQNGYTIRYNSKTGQFEFGV